MTTLSPRKPISFPMPIKGEADGSVRSYGVTAGALFVYVVFAASILSLFWARPSDTSSSLEFGPQAIFHEDGRGTPRLDYVTEAALLHGLVALPPEGAAASPRLAAEAYLKLNFLRYGLSPQIPELQFKTCNVQLFAYECRFDQIAERGLSEGEGITVCMDYALRVTRIANDVMPRSQSGRIAA